ncbi:hypothetical protein [Halomonas sp.]|uniref:phage tail tube protein n=1 Tax=Halomonas sp. TaxID=1486246 RepID=UPI00298DF04B|nr:hypothetical protein [Halomonas sp.]MDW7746586.1 hypothetical protein [Halomonas sp.]
MTRNLNVVVPAGKVYFNPRREDGTYEGYRYLAETPAFTITAQGETLPVDGSDGPTAERLFDVPIRVSRSGRTTLRDMNAENYALFMMGEASEVSQTDTPVTDEAHAVMPGRFYQLGASTDNPGGVRNVSAVDVQDETDTTTYVAGTDYVVHAEIGMLEILEDGTITEETIHVDYTPAAETRDRVTTNQLGARRGEVKFVANNTEGQNRDIYIPEARLSPDGELPMKSRENPQEMPLIVAVQTRDGYAQLYVDGRAAA